MEEKMLGIKSGNDEEKVREMKRGRSEVNLKEEKQLSRNSAFLCFFGGNKREEIRIFYTNCILHLKEYSI